jgi:beta-lactamase superfamily II metal-dependent hydrolase
MILEIANVEHGACALITTSNNKRVMIDCGHNTTTGWRPGDTLIKNGIYSLDRLIISNYDEDHVSAYSNLIDQVVVSVITRNWRVPPVTIRKLKSEQGIGRGIERLVNTLERTFTCTVPVTYENDFGDTSFQTFANGYGAPPFGFDDENNLSLVTFVTCGNHRMIFPGDMEKAGWKALLLDSQFVRLLGDVTVFVASHHGRENGYCEDILDRCPNIQLIVISDKSKEHETQETVDRYRKYAKGILYNGKPRHVLTTRRDGYMKFTFNPSGSGQVVLENGGI